MVRWATRGRSADRGAPTVRDLEKKCHDLEWMYQQLKEENSALTADREYLIHHLHELESLVQRSRTPRHRPASVSPPPPALYQHALPPRARSESATHSAASHPSLSIWLNTISMSQHLKYLRRAEVTDIETLLLLAPSDLTAMGIPPHHAKVITRHLDQMRA
eukprot:Sspe_Gene.117015::Locus_107310_Transcript_1_1_Confidence_1.000_Length_595::g.117015::m.117015